MRCVLIVAWLCLTLAWPVPAQDGARRHYREGQKAERQGRELDAWLLYQRARMANPGNPLYVRLADSLRVSAAQALATIGREDDARQVVGMDPADDAEPLVVEEVEEDPRDVRNLREPVDLKPQRVVTDFYFKGTLREAYEHVAERFGLRTLFDDDFKGRGEREVKIELLNTGFPDAIVALNDVAQAFIVPISSRMFLVAEDTQAKRGELDPVASATVEIPEAMKPEEAQELSQAVQQTLDMKRSFLTGGGRSVVLRDTVRKVRMAQDIYRAMSHPRGEVLVEVDIIQVNNDRTVEIGLNPPTAFPMANFSQFWNVQPPELTAEASTSMIALGGGDSVFGITVGPSALSATLANGQGRLVQRLSLRAVHGSEAEMNIGERFPIINASFSAPAGVDADDPNFIQPIPSFTFEELGLTLRITPTIHSGSEVTLQVSAEFKLLAGGAVNGVPILANRLVESQVRLADGEHALLGGMTVLEQRNSRSGLAGLAEIPFLGRLFRKTTRRFNQSDLVIVIRPRIVRLPASEIEPSLTIRFGPENRPLPAL